MRSKTLTTLPTLGASGALLGLALLASTLGAGRSRADEASATARLIETEAVQAEEAAVPKRHRRHARGLAMPYFSFAQSLRPRN